MAAVGIAPSNAGEILADDKRRRFHIAGDKPGTKNGCYQLKIEFEFAYGWFMSFKEGVTHKWHTKSKKSYTPEERAEFKKKLDNERKRKERELKQQRTEAAVRAKRIWDKCSKVGSTGYLERKRCDLNGARLSQKLIVVPAYYEGKVVSLQFIAEDGAKRFIKGGQLEGAYFPIAKADEDKELLIICEGFATGDSIRKALGLPVIVSFNAGNLKPVAEAMRAKYPMSRFIIAADNDQWTKKPDGVTPWNPGLEYARQAAVAIGGAAVIWPEFAADSEARYTDFNDAYIHLGTDYVKERILSATPKVQPEGYGGGGASDSIGSGSHAPATTDMPSWLEEEIPLDAYNEEARELVELYTAADHGRVVDDNKWREKLYYSKTKPGEDPKIAAKSLGNLRLFLENDKALQLFCYDKFAHEKIVYKCPPWGDVKEFKPRSLNDDDITFLTCELERRGILQPISTVAKVLNAVIKNNARNPAVEYFNSLKWDGKERLDTWLTYYCGAEFDNMEYLAQVGRKWLTAAVTRVFEPGRKFDHIPVFEGPQNSGKSLMLKELATIHGTEYFDDTIRVSDLGNPNIVPKLQGVLIVEIAEMSGFNRKDANELKQAITTTHDRIVLKYQNEASRYPRQFVFAGTLNPMVHGYLHDPTGNRRFWPVRVGQKIDIETLQKDKEQLWAEAVQRYRAGETLYLEGDIYKLAQSAQQDRNLMHPWFPDIEVATRSRDNIPMKEIWELVGLTDKAKRTRVASDDVSKVMTELGFEHKRKRLKGEREYMWVRKTDLRELDLGDQEEVQFD